MTGEMPNMQIDHKNMVGTDNRWSNLRLATKSQNLANSRARKDNFSGFKGAYYDKKSGKWRAQVRHNGKLHSLGRFPTPREANAAYLVAASKLFGEFARAG